jgi:hypothetical protein
MIMGCICALRMMSVSVLPLDALIQIDAVVSNAAGATPAA